MNKQISFIKSVLPIIVKNFSQFFELDITIKLFGVKVFHFHFPPESDVDPNKSPESDVEPNKCPESDVEPNK